MALTIRLADLTCSCFCAFLTGTLLPHWINNLMMLDPIHISQSALWNHYNSIILVYYR
jgi:hypothetical protein